MNLSKTTSKSFLTFVLFGFGFFTFIPIFLPIQESFITISYRAMVLGWSMILFAAMFIGNEIKFNIYSFMLFCFLAIYTVRLINDSNQYDFGMPTNVLLLKFFSLVLLPFFIISILKPNPNIELYSLSILSIVVFLSFIALIITNDSRRLSGNEILNPITLGYYAGYYLISLYIVIKNYHLSQIYKLLIYFMAIIGLIVIFATLSRGPILALIIIAFIELIYSKRFKFSVLSTITILSFFVFLIGYSLSDIFSNMALDRLTIDFDSDEGTGEVRVLLWLLAIDLISSNLLLGSHVTTEIGYVHNIYLESIMSTGILGSMLFLIPIYISIKWFMHLKSKSLIPSICHYFLIYTLVTITFSGTIYTASFLFALLPVVLNSYVSYIKKYS